MRGARDGDEAGNTWRAFDDLDGRAINIGHGVAQFVASIASVREYVLQRGMAFPRLGDDTRGTIPVLNVGGMCDQPQQGAVGSIAH